MKGPIRSLEAAYLLHMTEDGEKVGSAVARFLSVEGVPEIEDMEGHYGNRIRRVRIHLTADDAQKAFESVSGNLSDDQKKELLGDLGAHLDEHSALFLRFDKQRLVSGSPSFGSADPVRVKVKPRSFLLRGDATKFYSNLLRG